MSAMAENSVYAGWNAEMSMGFESRRAKTVLASLKHSGPLRVQRPFYPENDVCHVYLLHPPGGVVGGDSLSIDIRATKNSHALITTPGSTKFYRSAGETAYATQNLFVEKGSVLEWFPQENMLFPGAKVNMKSRIQLETGANFIGWELFCLGRPANKEVFHTGQLDSVLKIFRDDKPLLIERQRVHHENQLNSNAGLRGFPMNGVFICTSCDEQMLVQTQEIIAASQAEFPIGATRLDDVLIVRVLGYRTESIQRILIKIWQALRPQITQKTAVLPRIWST